MANPYHDKEGKFTSRENQGQAEQKPNFRKISQKIKLKEGIDLSSFPMPNQIGVNSVKNDNLGVIDTDFELTMPKDINDANAQGNKILGSNVIVKYADDTNLGQALEMNKGLKAVVSEFPQLFADDLLLSYGTAIRENRKFFTYQEQKDIIKKIYRKPEFDNVRTELSRSGIDLDNVMHLFINNAVLTENIKPFNFKRNKGTGGVTKSVGSKMSGIRTPDAIQINPDYMRNDLKMSIVKMQPNVDNGGFLSWGNTSPTFATATHELGHHCYNMLQNFMDSNERRKLFDLTVGAQSLKAKGEISGYASTSKEEQIAEAFSDYFCRGENATNHNKNLVKFFKGIYNRIYGTK